MTIRRFFNLVTASFFFCSILLALILILMLRTGMDLNESQQIRYESYLAADELRQISDDLTRLARTYVATRSPKYEDMYWEVLDVQEGKKPRPDGQTIALESIMKDLGFTDAEFAKINEAKQNSDGLVWTETIAMNAVKGRFHDKNNNFTIKKEPDDAFALNLMFNDQYHQYVKEIMVPIDDFFLMLEKRTSNTVDAHLKKSRLLLWTALSIIGALLVVTVIAHFMIQKQISKPVGVLVKEVNHIGDGDLTRDISSLKSKNEIGTIAQNLNEMTLNLNAMFLDITSGTDALNVSSKKLSGAAQVILENAERTADQTREVEVSAQDMTTAINSVAASTEQTSANLHMIVSAVEEMTTTISEIANSTVKGNETTHEAVRQAEEVSKQVVALKKAAVEIGGVTESIAEISEQTNLLALNATIEAARAGSAGKGFMVVAGEIKALALQTAESTANINDKISGVQAITNDAISGIESIVGVISETNEIVTMVASSIEEQSATTNEISANVGQAADGVNAISVNVNDISAVAERVAKEISDVSQATEFVRSGSHDVDQSVHDLDKLSHRLTELVGRFQI